VTREEVIKSLETAVKNFERYSGDEYGREYDYAKVKAAMKCLKIGFTPFITPPDMGVRT